MAVKKFGSKTVCLIFDFIKRVQSKVVECIFPLKEIHRDHFLSFFLTAFAAQGVLNKDPNI
jgi:hypothetical protein